MQKIKLGRWSDVKDIYNFNVYDNSNKQLFDRRF